MMEVRAVPNRGGLSEWKYDSARCCGSRVSRLKSECRDSRESVECHGASAGAIVNHWGTFA
jgi:hypothetical protein